MITAQEKIEHDKKELSRKINEAECFLFTKYPNIMKQIEERIIESNKGCILIGYKVTWKQGSYYNDYTSGYMSDSGYMHMFCVKHPGSEYTRVCDKFFTKFILFIESIGYVLNKVRPRDEGYIYSIVWDNEKAKAYIEGI